MPQTAIAMLKRAPDARNAAERARRLARDLTDDDVVDNFMCYAEELERQALDLEQRARAIAETIGKTEALSADIRALIAEVWVWLRTLRSR